MLPMGQAARQAGQRRRPAVILEAPPKPPACRHLARAPTRTRSPRKASAGPPAAVKPPVAPGCSAALLMPPMPVMRVDRREVRARRNGVEPAALVKGCVALTALEMAARRAALSGLPGSAGMTGNNSWGREWGTGGHGGCGRRARGPACSGQGGAKGTYACQGIRCGSDVG